MTRVIPTSIVSSIKLPHSKMHNHLTHDLKIIKQSKYLILAQALFGINRLFLLQMPNFVVRIINVYCIVLVLLIAGYTYGFIHIERTMSYFILKHIIIVEYLILTLVTVLTCKKKLRKFFCNISALDEMLNIQDDLDSTTSVKRILCWIFFSSIYLGCEYLTLFFMNVGKAELTYAFFAGMVHESEQIFYFTLLRMVYVRLIVIKEHVCKKIPMEAITKENRKLDVTEIQKLANKKDLDVAGLHDAYQLLEKCADQLSYCMSFPMVVMLVSSGVTTVLQLKLFVQIIQLLKWECMRRPPVYYLIMRCLKYTSLLLIPCYYSSVTRAQATVIYNHLHDAINSKRLDSIEHQRVKTFFFLTRERKFNYKLGNIIELNMTLPLNYAGICVTYLIICQQFSKFFIDF